MALWQRLRLIFSAKANRAVDRLEDPEDALDLAYNRQLGALQKVRRSIADVVTAQKQLEIQQRSMGANRAKLDDLARRALQQGRDEVAASALTQSQLIEGQLGGIEQQIKLMAGQREALESAGEKVQARVASMRTQKETLKAQYRSAKATASAGETVTGIGKDMDEVEGMLDRAREKMVRTQARAEAVGELMETGMLARLSAGNTDMLEADVTARTVNDSVDVRLAEMRRQLGLDAAVVAGNLEAPGPAKKKPARRSPSSRKARS
ncbi:MAG: PspA/IM30 family protein [Candidatus Dormibacteria bacterium]